jgi:putative membrane protein
VQKNLREAREADSLTAPERYKHKWMKWEVASILQLMGRTSQLFAVVLIVRWLNGRDERPGVRLRTPREMLDERFAKGEIQRNEYEERRKALEA